MFAVHRTKGKQNNNNVCQLLTFMRERAGDSTGKINVAL